MTPYSEQNYSRLTRATTLLNILPKSKLLKIEGCFEDRQHLFSKKSAGLDAFSLAKTVLEENGNENIISLYIAKCFRMYLINIIEN